jgi:uncharacterized protein (TIGR02147 family)
LRSFARHLGLNSSGISQILNGTRKASPKLIARICDQLGWPSQTGYQLLGEDICAVLSSWYHAALLELVSMKGFQNDVEWIARKLFIKEAEVKTAIERLQRLGMIELQGGRWQRKQAHYTNYLEGQTSKAHKEHQKQVIMKALEAVDSCEQGRKDITSMTFTANSGKLKQAREKIREFRRDLCDFLEDGNGDAVYELGIQLFPLSVDLE